MFLAWKTTLGRNAAGYSLEVTKSDATEIQLLQEGAEARLLGIYIFAISDCIQESAPGRRQGMRLLYSHLGVGSKDITMWENSSVISEFWVNLLKIISTTEAILKTTKKFHEVLCDHSFVTMSSIDHVNKEGLRPKYLSREKQNF